MIPLADQHYHYYLYASVSSSLRFLMSHYWQNHVAGLTIHIRYFCWVYRYRFDIKYALNCLFHSSFILKNYIVCLINGWHLNAYRYDSLLRKYLAGSADFHILISDLTAIHFYSYLGYSFMLLSICKSIILNWIN